MHVITTVEPQQVATTSLADARLVWIGVDERGVELEIVASTSSTPWWSFTSCRRACRGEDMSEADTYRLGPDVPADQELHDRQGRRVDDGYVEQGVTEALGQVRGRGRPSLSQAGESPLLRVRISRDLDKAVRKAAEDAGASRSEWVRKVLDEAAHRAS